MFRIGFLVAYALILLIIPELSYIEKVALVVPFIVALLFIDYYVIHRVEYHNILTIGIMLIITFTVSYLISLIFFGENSIFELEPKWNRIVISVIGLFCFYFSFRIGSYTDYFRKKKDDKGGTIETKYLVDTCAIIDGRLLDISKSGFIPKNLVIPNFVIHELQLISDSYSHEKRTKGRRGLDLLKNMKNSDHLSVQIISEDVEEIKTVDSKLLALAKKYDYKIVTTDFNLTKVAQLQGVQTLNINVLATLLKPALGIGERIRVYVLKKGNNNDQGLAFLPDDTMVVVEDAEKFIGKQKQVVITSYIQSESGKMAFAKVTGN